MPGPRTASTRCMLPLLVFGNGTALRGGGGAAGAGHGLLAGASDTPRQDVDPELTKYLLLGVALGVCVTCVVACCSAWHRARQRARRNRDALLPNSGGGGDPGYGSRASDQAVLREIAARKAAASSVWVMKLNEEGTHVVWEQEKPTTKRTLPVGRGDESPLANSSPRARRREESSAAQPAPAPERKEGEEEVASAQPPHERAFLSHLSRDGTITWQSASRTGIRPAAAQGPSGVPAGDLARVAARPYPEKAKWFQAQLARFRIPYEQGHVTVTVRRSNILGDTHSALMGLSPGDMRRVFRYSFAGEDGLDAGGLAREYHELVSRELFRADAGLFRYSSGSNMAFSINPHSELANPAHLEYFALAGRFLGKALLDGHVVPATPSVPLLKQLQGAPLSLSDVGLVDPTLYRSLKWIATHSGVDALDLDFTVTETALGASMTVLLKPHGDRIALTDANKAEYIQLRLRHLLRDSVQDQLAALLRGVREVIPPDLLSVFDPFELELVLCGMPRLDLRDWQRHTVYSGAFSARKHQHRVVRWFWDLVRDMDASQRARLLQFATGTSRVPVGGFRALTSYDGHPCRFMLNGVPGEDGRLVIAHTCFARLDVPQYRSKAAFKQALDMALASADNMDFGLE